MGKFMNEFVVMETELKGLFKIHASKAVDEILQQIIFSTAKEWLEKSDRRNMGKDCISNVSRRLYANK